MAADFYSALLTADADTDQAASALHTAVRTVRAAHPGSAAVTELLIGVLAGSTLLPFIQAMATKAGEDAYQLIRGKLSRQGRKRAKEEIRDTGTVTLADRIPRDSPDATDRESGMAARLERVRLPANGPAGCVSGGTRPHPMAGRGVCGTAAHGQHIE